jgi:hypothetical protein
MDQWYVNLTHVIGLKFIYLNYIVIRLLINPDLLLSLNNVTY